MFTALSCCGKFLDHSLSMSNKEGADLLNEQLGLDLEETQTEYDMGAQITFSCFKKSFTMHQWWRLLEINTKLCVSKPPLPY